MKKPTKQTIGYTRNVHSLKPSRKEQAIVWLCSPVIVLASVGCLNLYLFTLTNKIERK